MTGWHPPLPHQTLMALAGIVALVGAMGQWGHGEEVDASGATVRELDWSGLQGSLGAAVATLAALAVVTAMRPARPHARTLGATGLFAGILLVAFVAATNGGSPLVLDMALFNERRTDLGWGLLLVFASAAAGIAAGVVGMRHVARVVRRPPSLAGAGWDVLRHPGTRGLALIFALMAVSTLLPWARGAFYTDDAADATQESFRVLGYQTSLGLACLAAALLALIILPLRFEARLRSAAATLLAGLALVAAASFGPGSIAAPEGRTVGSYAMHVGAVLALSTALAGVLVGVYRTLPMRVVAREAGPAAAQD